ncbi:MAG: 23S rRNA (pseudouridine(1915)-N(3))-methyltransferase RlmH [Pseudomonadales bacterium]
MKLKVLAIGTRAPSWVSAGFNEYAARMPPHMAIELVEVSAPAHRGWTAERLREEEGGRLLGRVGDGDRIVALDGGGKTLSTEKLAARMDDWRMLGGDVIFMIGGADGLHSRVLAAAQETLSLSALTFPHMLVRVILAEQLYRAWTLLEGHPYHRG